MSTTLQDNYFDAKDLVFDEKADKSGIYGGGFRFDSLLKKYGISPIQTHNQSGGTIGQVSDLFKSLVVPTQLAYPPNTHITEFVQTGGNAKEKVVEDKLWNQLLELARVSPEKVKKTPLKNTTKKKRHSSQRKTKKQMP